MASRDVSTRVTVRFFGSLREVVGRATMDLEVDEPCVSGLRSTLASRVGAAALRALTAPGVRVCVNQTIVRGNVGLGCGDEVAFLPPVTGG